MEDTKFYSSEIQADFKAELNELDDFGGELLERTKPRVYCPYDDCGKSYAHPQSLYTHIQSEHLGRRFPCTVEGCRYETTQHGHLKLHMQRHAGIKPYHCTVDGCGYECTESGALKSHMFTHNGLKPHQCTECEYECTTSGNLKTHMFTHSGLKPHKCTEDGCGYECTTLGHLKSHMNRHAGIKPYKCTEDGCGYECTESGSLKIHRNVHDGLKPHKCTDCGYVCTTSGHLKSHIKSVHQGIPQHYKQCEHNVRAVECTYCRARCKNCLLEPCSISIPKWLSTKLCIRCYYHLNPTLKNARRYLIKQKWVTADILNAFPDYSWVIDRPVEGCRNGRRPDLLLDLGFIVLIIEIDEDAHRGDNYSEMCEHARYNEIYTTLQYRPIYVIRLNPDKYTSAGVTYKSVFRKLKDGYGVTAAYSQRLVALISAIQECLNMEHNAADFKCIFLFYDNYAALNR